MRAHGGPLMRLSAAATILGCEGPRLTGAEAAFFREADPLGFILFARNVETPDQLRRLTGELRAAVGRDAPVLVDQEGGRVQRLRAPHWHEWLPPLDEVAGLAPAARARGLWLRYRLIAAELRAVGIDTCCAPTADIAGPETHLFTVADLRSLWIEVDVYEADADRVRAGSAAAVVTRAIPGESFPGHVTYAGGVVDSATRTVKVRVEVDNQQGRLRPGMYAEVRIEEQSATRAAPPAGDSSVVVSELAVQDLDGQAVVFVPEGVAGRFVARAVTVGPRLPGGLVTILGGLTVGEQVVTRGAFQLKSELLKESFGDDD